MKNTRKSVIGAYIFVFAFIIFTLVTGSIAFGNILYSNKDKILDYIADTEILIVCESCEHSNIYYLEEDEDAEDTDEKVYKCEKCGTYLHGHDRENIYD